MATFLASDVTHEARMNLAAFYPDANPDALTLVQKAHATVVQRCGLYALTTLDLALVAGQREYDLDPDVFRILDAGYVTSAGETNVGETSVDYLDQYEKGWRYAGANATPGVPTRYYEMGGKVGLVPPPATASTGGTPTVRLTVLKRNAPTALTSPLPPQAPTIDAWVYQVCLYWAIRNQPDLVALYAPLAKAALDELSAYVQGRVARYNTSVVPVTPATKPR